MQLNYLDIGIIAIVAIGLIGGLIGRLPRKIMKTIFVIASAIAAYIVCDKYLVEMVLNLNISDIPVIGNGKEGTVATFIQEFLKDSLDTLYDIPALKSLLENLPRVIAMIALFFVVGLLGVIIVPWILGLFVKLFTRKSKKGTAILSLGLFGAINGAVFAFIIASPILFLSPALKNASSIYKMLPDESKSETVEKIVNIAEEQVSGSVIVKFADEKFFSNEDNFLCEFMIYDVTEEGSTETKTSYMYNDLGDVAGLVGTYNEIQAQLDSFNLDDLGSMDPEDIKDIFESLGDNLNSDFAKEAVSGVLEETVGISIDLTDVDLAAEGETIAAVAEALSDPDNIDVEELSSQLAESELVLAVADSNPGILADLDESTQNDIKTQLQAQVADESNDFSQEDYDKMMKLFEAQQNSGGAE